MLKDPKYYRSDEDYKKALDNEYVTFVTKMQKSLKYDLCISNIICKLKDIRNKILGITLERSTESGDIIVNRDKYLVESSTYINIVTSDGFFIKANE